MATPRTGLPHRSRPLEMVGTVRRAKKRMSAVVAHQAAAALPGRHGESSVVDYTPSGQKSGVVRMSHRMLGQTIGNPALSLAYSLRKQMQPIRIAPTVVFDGDGNPIARIEVDSVTGKRRRVALA